MPELTFQIDGVEAAANGLVPLLHFKLKVTTVAPSEEVVALLLHAQIQLEPAQRTYAPAEREKLADLFGAPERWGQTLRNRLWTHAQATANFADNVAEFVLPVPCTYDLNIAGTKYFYALENGEIPLLFLFSGTMLYAANRGQIQVQRIPWTNECRYRLSVQLWQAMMEEHFPNTGWLSLRRDVFERLCERKRRLGLTTWESVIDQLLPHSQQKEEEVHADATHISG